MISFISFYPFTLIPDTDSYTRTYNKNIQFTDADRACYREFRSDTTQGLTDRHADINEEGRQPYRGTPSVERGSGIQEG